MGHCYAIKINESELKNNCGIFTRCSLLAPLCFCRHRQEQENGAAWLAAGLLLGQSLFRLLRGTITHPSVDSGASNGRERLLGFDWWPVAWSLRFVLVAA